MEFEKYGQIKYNAGQAFPSKYTGEMQQNIVVQLQDGNEERVYFKAGDPNYLSFKRGQQVKIIWSKTSSGNMRKTVFALNNSQPMNNYNNISPPPAPQHAPHSRQTSTVEQDVEFINRRLTEFNNVFNLVANKFPQFTEETKRSITTSILIQGHKEGRDFTSLSSSYATYPQPLPEPERQPQNQAPQPEALTPPPLPNFTQSSDTSEKLPQPVPVKPVVQPYPESAQPTYGVNQQKGLEALDNIPF